MLKIRDKDKEPLTWEFEVKEDLKKLPNYPVTHKTVPEGMGVIITDGQLKCEASFHGYTEDSRYGKNFYLGSAGLRLGREYTKYYRGFLSKAFGINVGVHRKPINVKLEFREANMVFVSRDISG